MALTVLRIHRTWGQHMELFLVGTKVDRLKPKRGDSAADCAAAAKARAEAAPLIVTKPGSEPPQPDCSSNKTGVNGAHATSGLSDSRKSPVRVARAACSTTPPRVPETNQRRSTHQSATTTANVHRGQGLNGAPGVVAGFDFAARHSICADRVHFVSARTGAGVPEMLHAVAAALHVQDRSTSKCEARKTCSAH